MGKIQTMTVPTGGQATIDFTAIPATYTHLVVVITGRNDAANNESNLLMQLNGDTAANYDWAQVQVYSQSTAPAGSGAAGATAAQVGVMNGANAAASKASTTEINLPNYAGTTFHKAWLSSSADRTGYTPGGINVNAVSGAWSNTAAITRLTLSLSAGNFVAGTVCTLYGVDSTATGAAGTMIWRGAWASATAYNPYDVVRASARTFLALLASTGAAPTTGPYPSAVLADTPYYYYRLDDAAGSVAPVDSSGGGLTGAAHGTVTFGAASLLSGDADPAATFASGGYLTGPSSFANPQTYTLECWFKTTATVGQGLFVFDDSNNTTYNAANRLVYLDATGHVTIKSDASAAAASATAYNDGLAHHLVVTLAAGVFTVYVDGASVATLSYTPSSFTGYWVIAACSGQATFTGTLDDVAIYTTALTAARVSAHCSAASGAQPWQEI